MKISTTIKNVAMALIKNVAMALTLSAIPSLASAQWQNATATYKTDETSTIKLQRGTNNTYGFVNLCGDKSLDFESMYGEARARHPIGKGFALGVEYNGGTGMNDIIRPHLSYSRKFGPVFVDTKFSPVETSRTKGSQLGVYASIGYKKFGLEGWADFDYINGEIVSCGEIEGSFKTGKDLSLVVRAEKYPWQHSPKVSTGLKLNL